MNPNDPLATSHTAKPSSFIIADANDVHKHPFRNTEGSNGRKCMQKTRSLDPLWYVCFCCKERQKQYQLSGFAVKKYKFDTVIYSIKHWIKRKNWNPKRLQSSYQTCYTIPQK